MSATPDQVATSILSTLAATANGLSCQPGTPERHIIDACAEAISAAYVNQYLNGGMLDINSKAGLELEQFVGIFGFGRMQGKAAVGVITVTLTTPGIVDQTIAIGSQFYTTPGVAGVSSTLYFAATQAVVIPAQSFTVTVPVQCTTTGGSGNVPPDSITSQSASIGASTVTNLQAMTGGVDVETDQALRQRFSDTLLRNIAGTEDWYINMALQNSNVSRAAVYGPVSLFATQITVPTSTLTLPVTADVKYVWPDMSSCFTDLGQLTETFYSPNDDYTMSSGASPVFTTVNTGALTPGNIVDLEFQYTTQSSRNDPINGITNKVDVFIDGSSPFTVTETTVVTATTLSNLSSNTLYTGNFARVGEVGAPSSSHRFMRLGSVPIITFPSSITVASTTYTQGTHYHLLRGTTLLSGSQKEVAGIEWEASGPANGTEITLNYTYNQAPEILDAVNGISKQICTDVLVHQAEYQFITPCLTVEYDRTYSVATVNTAITNRLQIYFQGLGFGASLKLGNLASAVQQVLGVVDVHITTFAESGSHYGIEVYNTSTDVSPASIQTADFSLDDNQLTVYRSQVILRAPTT